MKRRIWLHEPTSTHNSNAAKWPVPKQGPYFPLEHYLWTFSPLFLHWFLGYVHVRNNRKYRSMRRLALTIATRQSGRFPNTDVCTRNQFNIRPVIIHVVVSIAEINERSSDGRRTSHALCVLVLGRGRTGNCKKYWNSHIEFRKKNRLR